MNFFTNVLNNLDVPTVGNNGVAGNDDFWSGFSDTVNDMTDNLNDILNPESSTSTSTTSSSWNIFGNGDNDSSTSTFTMSLGDFFGGDNTANEDSVNSLNLDELFSELNFEQLFDFAKTDIETNDDACDLLDQIEEDFNSLMTLADPARLFDPLFADQAQEEEQGMTMIDGSDGGGLDSLFAGMGDFFQTVGGIVSNTIDTVVNVVTHTSPRCTDDNDALLREVFSDFAKCNNVDMTLADLESAMTMDALNTGLKCINELFPEVSAASSSTDRKLQMMFGSQNPSSFCSAEEQSPSLQSDECTSGILGEENVVGKLFRMMLVTPDTTCGCLSILEQLPDCRTSFTNGGFVDGGRFKKYKCLLESSTCPFFESACTDRLEALDTCLPSIDTFRNQATDASTIDCKEVMCSCEAVGTNNINPSINYAAQLMELPLTDMCQTEAESSPDSIYGDVPQRYELLRSTCGYTSEDAFANLEPLQPAQAQEPQPLATDQEEEVVVVQPEVVLEVEDQPDIVVGQPAEAVKEEVVAAVAAQEPLEQTFQTRVISSNLLGKEENDGTLAGAFIGVVVAGIILVGVSILIFVVLKKKNANDNINHHESPPVDGIAIKPSNTQETNSLFTDDESSKGSVANTP